MSNKNDEQLEPINIINEKTKIVGTMLNNKVHGDLSIETEDNTMIIPFINGKINGKMLLNDKDYIIMENGILNGESYINGMKLMFENGTLKKKDVV